MLRLMVSLSSLDLMGQLLKRRIALVSRGNVTLVETMLRRILEK